MAALGACRFSLRASEANADRRRHLVVDRDTASEALDDQRAGDFPSAGAVRKHDLVIARRAGILRLLKQSGGCGTGLVVDDEIRLAVLDQARDVFPATIGR